MKELGEIKRADAKRLEAKFLELLKEQTDLSSASTWSEVRPTIADDPRFVAVKSSSTKEDLFNKYLASLAASQANEQEDAERKAREKKERAAASLKEREEQVRAQKQKLDQDAHRSRAEADRGSDEREFGQLLIDAVRSYEVRGLCQQQSDWCCLTAFVNRHAGRTCKNRSRTIREPISLRSRR